VLGGLKERAAVYELAKTGYKCTVPAGRERAGGRVVAVIKAYVHKEAGNGKAVASFDAEAAKKKLFFKP
jgi:monoamine oxidase